MFWRRIIDWFRDFSERQKLISDFNKAARESFICGSSPTLLEASVSMGDASYKHELSSRFFSGFRIKSRNGRPLTRGEMLDIGRVIVYNPTFARKLVVLGWDTLEVHDTTGKGVKWALREFAHIGYMLKQY